MAVRLDECNKVCVLSIEGDFAGDDAAEFRQLVEGRAHSGAAMDLLVDFEKSAYIDSVGLEALLFARKRCQETGGKMSLANLDRNLRTVLEITRLSRHFEIQTTVSAGSDH